MEGPVDRVAGCHVGAAGLSLLGLRGKERWRYVASPATRRRARATVQDLRPRPDVGELPPPAQPCVVASGAPAEEPPVDAVIVVWTGQGAASGRIVRVLAPDGPAEELALGSPPRRSSAGIAAAVFLIPLAALVDLLGSPIEAALLLAYRSTQQ